ncbi:unnamed protein product [Rotaria sordida]|uniref:Uncharacterized protein n=2 Tax=Rotaria sordida TaxID=392033 RepID=A0A819AG30_9BILA|nr:unnamed protein product [Rotaria sordida]
MFDGPLQWYFLFGIIQNGMKMPVDLKFRPPLNQRLFYHTIEIERHVPATGQIIERQETESVEKIVAINKPNIYITNLKAKIEPQNMTKLDRLLKRPYFDRLEERELPGDFRSQDHPFGYAWMLFPSPESLMIPDIIFYEGQKWSVKMIGGLFEIHYELTNIDHKQHTVHIDGRNGICLNRAAGNKKWNASWIVDSRSGIIKQMQLELDHEYESPKRTTHKTINKVLTREVDEQTIFDYEIDDNDHEDL